jgi:hypothetical protein
LAAILLLLASWLSALALYLELDESEERLLEASKRLEAESLRREDVERRYLRDRLSQENMARELPALVERFNRAASRPESRPQAPPAEPVAMAALRNTLNRALRNAGHDRVRFFRVQAGSGTELAGVQVHVLGENGVAAEAYDADRVRIVLDLEHLMMNLTFEDGVHLAGGQRHPLPPEGLSLGLSRAAAVALCGELGGLAEQRGNLPPEPPPDPRPRSDSALFAFEREEWLERLNSVLSLADPSEKLRCIGVGDLMPEGFQDVMLLGYSRGFLLDRTFQAREAVFELDETSGTVTLCLKAGTLERKGRTVPLREEGYRLLLPGVKPEEAAKLLLGRVHR